MIFEFVKILVSYSFKRFEIQTMKVIYLGKVSFDLIIVMNYVFIIDFENYFDCVVGQPKLPLLRRFLSHVTRE